jgi:hypothetical protein
MCQSTVAYSGPQRVCASARRASFASVSAIVTWIERTYHRRRRQSALGRLTPVEFEMINTPQATLAA